jgi:hypothetical protein
MKIACFSETLVSTAGANLCFRRPFEVDVDGKGIRGAEGSAGKEAKWRTESQPMFLYRVLERLCACADGYFWLKVESFLRPDRQYMRLFSFYTEASDVGETHSVVPGTVPTNPHGDKIQKTNIDNEQVVSRNNISAQLIRTCFVKSERKQLFTWSQALDRVRIYTYKL